jgi:hypothetical protein
MQEIEKASCTILNFFNFFQVILSTAKLPCCAGMEDREVDQSIGSNEKVRKQRGNL